MNHLLPVTKRIRKKQIPFYYPTQKVVNENDSPWDDPKCIEVLGTYAVKILAILMVGTLAVIYDGQWIPVAMGVGCVLLGVELKSKFVGGGK